MPNKTLRLSATWAVILAVSVLVIALQRVRGGADPEGMTKSADPASAADSVPDVEPLRMEAELLGKIVVAAHAWAPTLPTDLLLENARPLETGNASERLAYAITVGEVDRWERGLELARSVEIPAASARQAELKSDVVSALEELSASDGDFASVGDEKRERIEAELGYFGRLLSPDGATEASGAFGVIIFAGLWYVSVFLLGLVALVVLAGLLLTRKMAPTFEPAADGHVALVLGETFAIWMVSYLGLTICTHLVAGFLPESMQSTGGLVLSIAAMAGSLGVLAYPRLRGVSSTQIRSAIGLHAGGGALSEIGAGIACYVSAVPILVVGGVIYFILTLIAQRISGEQAPPSHPAVEMLGQAGAFEIVLLFILASVMAPIVEEIAFRGLLYGHLRATVAPRARVASAAVSAIVSSVIFAAIHPQGLMFVPALGGLAVGFCLYREMRGSLVAPMVAHGINNALTLSLGLALF